MEQSAFTNWTRESFFSNTRWYHATQTVFAKAIIQDGVKAKINANKPLDFGYGFYLTNDFNWAKKYLTEQLLVSEEDGTADAIDGRIIEYEFTPSLYLDEYHTKFFSALDTEFADFVFRNRVYYRYHFISHCVHRYDMIGGPMSDGMQIHDFIQFSQKRITKGELYERLLEPKESWQLLLHNQALCDKLIVKNIYNAKGELVNAETI